MNFATSDLYGHINRIKATDPEMNNELEKILKKKYRPAWLDDAARALTNVNWTGPEEETPLSYPGYNKFEPEAIVLRYNRPVLSIIGGKAELKFSDTDSETWRKRLQLSAPKLAPAIASIGRIEVKNHPSGFNYMGTGWVIGDGIIVTNRHVALTFAEQSGEGFRFLIGFDRKNEIGVDIDFLEEVGNSAQNEYKIGRILYISSEREPDVAFLQLDTRSRKSAPEPIALLEETIPSGTIVAVIGYPARDNRIPDQSLMDSIFGKIYDKKRLSPGFTKGLDRGALMHDCSTLGGNSGSPVVDLTTGKVCGLHFAGRFLQANYAVPSTLVAEMLDKMKNSEKLTTLPQPKEDTMAISNTSDKNSDGQELRITIPIEVSVKIGRSTTTDRSVSVSATGVKASRSNVSLDQAVSEAKRLLASRADVLNVEAGWMFSNGWITDKRSVVVAVRRKLSEKDLDAQGIIQIPKEISGLPVDIRSGNLEDFRYGGVCLEKRTAEWDSPYEPYKEVPLDEVDEEMKVILHASPDAGWPVLSEFLTNTKRQLTIGMYDFTAQHIVDTVEESTKPAKRKLSLVLQRGEDIGKGTKQADIPDAETVDRFRTALSKRFSFAWASAKVKGSLFRSAYHIKVAVRDSSAFWLSSGNWQSSNQPPFDPLKEKDTTPSLLLSNNREWHTVVENERLAQILEKYLIRDRKQAAERGVEEGVPLEEPMVWVSEQYFQPTAVELETRARYFAPLVLSKRIRIQPLLTPDNYSEHVEELINSARKTIYFQNQSLKISQDENPQHFEKLLKAFKKKQDDGLEVRIIIRRIGDLRKTISAIKDYGFDTDKVRLQTNCHTKGIIVDGKCVMLGSQNWTGDGTGYNRDASLIIYDQEAAEYFQKLFLFDWERIGPGNIDESLPPPELATSTESVPRPGMILMPLSHWSAL